MNLEKMPENNEPIRGRKIIRRIILVLKKKTKKRALKEKIQSLKQLTLKKTFLNLILYVVRRFEKHVKS